MIHKKLFSIVRGKATPVQIFLACLLGAMIGFQPGFAQAPLLLGGLIGLLVILNANLFVAAMVTAGAFVLSLLSLELQFGLGRVLIDGPTRPLFAWAVNAPVLAWAGLGNYVAVGGVVLGAVVGGGVGLLTGGLLIRVRSLLAKVESDSKLFEKLSSNGLFKIVAWLLIGGLKAKKGSYADLAGKLVGNPIRISGVVLVVLAGGLVTVLVMLLEGPLTTTLMTRGLTQANGAPVDLEHATVSLGQGQISLSGLALVDAGKRDRYLFQAETVELDVAQSDLLSKRFVLDRVLVADAQYDTPRPPESVRPGEPMPGDTPDGGPGVGPDGEPIEDQPETHDLGKYVEDVRAWDQRLSQARRWLGKLGGKGEDEPDAQGRVVPTREQLLSDPETLEAYLLRQARELGYSRVNADHLVEGSPLVVIEALEVQRLTTERAPGVSFNIEANDLSSHPSLWETPATLGLASDDGRFVAQCEAGGPITARASGFDMAEILGGVRAPDEVKRLRNGTVDLELAGVLAGGAIDGDITATFRDAIIDVPKVGERQIRTIPVTIAVSGPIDRPRIEVNGDELKEAAINALKDAAVDQALDRLDEEFGDQINDVVDEDTRKKVRDRIRGFLGGGDD